RILSSDTAGLMRSQQHIRACQRGEADVLDDVIVVADQYPRAEPPWQIEHRVALAAADRRVLEGLQLAMTMDGAIGKRNDVGVMEGSRGGAFDPAGANRDPVPPRQLAQALCARAGGNRLRQRPQLLQRQVADEPVAAYTAFGEYNERGSLRGGLGDELFDFCKVGFPGTILVLHLHTGDPECSGRRHLLSPICMVSEDFGGDLI